MLLQHREEEGVLADEVRVDGALRVAGGLGDLVQRRTVEAALEEHVPSGGQKIRARLGLSLVPRLSRRDHCDTVGIVIPTVSKVKATRLRVLWQEDLLGDHEPL